MLIPLHAFVCAQALTPPEFPGGKKAFHEFLVKNLQWPDSTNINGVVTIGFFVEKDGRLTGLHLVKKLKPAYDGEALRVMAVSPKWIPAMRNNKFIRSAYTVPISFTQQNISNTPISDPISADIKPVPDDYEHTNKIFQSAEKVPSFPGGLLKFRQYIAEKLKNENFTAADAGHIIIAFVVERDGSLREIHLVRGVSQASDVAALRLIKGSPKWEPATMNGHPVRFAYSTPIEVKPNN